MFNKRGQGLSTNAIILIILGVVVLALLIIGFTIGWSNIAPWLSQNNVKTIVSQCETACTINSKYDYCTKVRTLKDDKTEIETSCATFSIIVEYDKYGIDECPLIECNFDCETINLAGQAASVKDLCEDTEDDITSITSVGSGKRCCIPKKVI